MARRRERGVARGGTLLGVCTVLVLWYALHLCVRSRVIPGPYETVLMFARLMTGDLALHMLASVLRIATAVLLAVAVGVPLGLWMGSSARADAVLAPVVYILHPIPKVAFLPLFLLLFGLGDSSKIILMLSVILFQMMLTVRDGVKEIPRELRDSVKTLGLNVRQTYASLVLPAVLPGIFSALRVSVGIGIATLFFSENFATTYGVGYFIMNCWVMADYVSMFAGIFAMSLMGILILKAVDLLECALCPWMRAM